MAKALNAHKIRDIGVCVLSFSEMGVGMRLDVHVNFGNDWS